MNVKVVELTHFGPYEAIMPEVSGTSSFTGRSEFYFDPEDDLRSGFILR
jgi:trans-L-3-hydroxyproline dehydratase